MKHEPRVVQLNTRVSAAELERFQLVAADMGLDVSSMIRFLVKQNGTGEGKLRRNPFLEGRKVKRGR